MKPEQKIVNLEEYKERKQRERAEELQKKVQSKMEQAVAVLKKLETETAVQKISEQFSFEINPELIADGWKPCGAIPIDENTLIKKSKFLKAIGWRKVKIEKSKYRNSQKPVIAFYGKN